MSSGDIDPFSDQSTDRMATGEILGAVHRRIVTKAYQRHEQAASIPNCRRLAPITIPSVGDAWAIMLTKDGERPYRDEKGKSFALVYVSPSIPGQVWVDSVDDKGVIERREFSAYYSGPGTLEEIEQDLITLLGGELPVPVPEATREESPEKPPLTEYEELRIFEERVERWSITPFSNTEESAA